MKETKSMIDAVQMRHHIHQHPELANQEFKTTQLLIDELSKASGLKILRPLPTGLVVEYQANEGPYIVFRADIDALPLQEETGVSFQSANGCMHACGHDVHTAVLYGFIQRVLEERPDQNILFFFQPAEEAEGGALKAIETGIFDTYAIEAVFAFHVNDTYPLGTIASQEGPLFANVQEFAVTFHGHSAHVAFPHQGKSAISALRTFLDGIDRIPRDPTKLFVCGIGHIGAGSAHNIIPEHGFANGTIRSYCAQTNADFYRQMEALAEAIHTQLGVETRLQKLVNYPEVVNDQALFDRFQPILDLQTAHRMMGGEDFGFFCRKYPSLMLFLGTQEKGKPHYGLHHPKFLPSDRVIAHGVRGFWKIVESYLHTAQ